jgi:hypothetical protein
MGSHHLAKCYQVVVLQEDEFIQSYCLKFDRDTTMAINTEKLKHILQHFVSTTANVQGAVMVTTDGLPLASSLPGGMDEERVSAMSAAMLSLGERIGRELDRGEMDRIYVHGDEGFSILTSCGADAVFLVLADQEAKQGVVMLEIKRALAELKLILDVADRMTSSRVLSFGE